ncbi:MAG TPA: hypothetical protein P5543_00600 [Planctomycetota bacterium]|nr:hypothetical protein [Planctomycetota bacterium]HRU50677.1 hypothetical protein [Planctomycetota bacterium]
MQRIVYFIFRILMIILENLPVRFAYDLGDFLGCSIYYLMPKRRRTVMKNLKIAYPDGLPQDEKVMTKKIFCNFLYMFIELGLLQRLFHKHNWKERFVDSDHTLEMFSSLKHRPAVVCSLHLGNFYLAGYIAPKIGAPLRIVMREIVNPYINQYIVKLLDHGGNDLVMKQGAYFSFQKGIAQGWSPTILVDQHGGRKSLHVDFMGKKAFTPASPASLLRKFNVPLHVGGVVRVGLFKFRLLYNEIPMPAWTEDKQRDLELATTILNKAYEDMIRRYPEQWFWMHRRWR